MIEDTETEGAPDVIVEESTPYDVDNLLDNVDSAKGAIDSLIVDLEGFQKSGDAWEDSPHDVKVATTESLKLLRDVSVHLGTILS